MADCMDVNTLKGMYRNHRVKLMLAKNSKVKAVVSASDLAAAAMADLIWC